MNQILLTTSLRENMGWSDKEKDVNINSLKRFRQSEEFLDALYCELEIYWNGILKALPVLREQPQNMRIHTEDVGDGSCSTDHLLFWPIGQELFAQVVRRVLNLKIADVTNPNLGDVVGTLNGVQQLEWRLHQPPWRYFLLTLNEANGHWRMRSEDRKEALNIARRILEWILGLDDLLDDEIEELKLHWQTRLIPSQFPEDSDKLWAEVVTKKQEISHT